MADTRATDIEDVTDYVEKTNTSKYTTLENGFEVGYEKYIMNVNSQEASNDNEIREVLESVPEAIYKEKKNTNRKSKIIEECRTDKEDIHNKTLISYEETLHQIDEEAQMRAQCDESIVGHNTDYLTENTIDYADSEHDIATYENSKPATNQGLTNTLKTLFTTDQNDDGELRLDAHTPVNERIYETSNELMNYTNKVSEGVIALASALKETVGVDLDTEMAKTSFQSVENTLTGEYISKFVNNTNLERDIYDLEKGKAHVKEQTIIDYINAITNALLDYVSNHENTKLSREVYDLEQGRTSIEKIKVKDYIDECINQVLDYVNNHENTVLSREVYNTSETEKTQVSKIKVKDYIDECINQMLDYVSSRENTILTKDFYDGKNAKSTVSETTVKEYVDACISKILDYVSSHENTLLSREIVNGTKIKATVNETNIKNYIDSCIDNVLSYISASNDKLVEAINALAVDTAGVSNYITCYKVLDKTVITDKKQLEKNINNNFKAVTAAVDELKNVTTGVSTSSFSVNSNSDLDKISHVANTVQSFTSGTDYSNKQITESNLFAYVRKADKELFARSSDDSNGDSVGDIMYVSESNN